MPEWMNQLPSCRTVVLKLPYVAAIRKLVVQLSGGITGGGG